jgi:hypothetical protein
VLVLLVNLLASERRESTINDVARDQAAVPKETHPGRTTFVAGLTALMFYVGLWRLSELRVEGTDPAFVHSDGFRTWLIVAAITATLWAAEFLAGCSRLRERPRDGGKLRSHIAMYVLFAVIVGLIVFAVQEGGDRPAVPLAWWRWGSYVLTGAGVVAAGPWVILLWLTHRALNRLGKRSQPAQVLANWPQLEAALVAIAGILVSATLTTAVLRQAVTAGVPGSSTGATFIPEASWPSSDVLLFGAFYTVLSAFAVVPVLITWRAIATSSLETLDAPGPMARAATTPAVESDDVKTEQTATQPVDRKEWERRLRLDHGIVGSPLALLSIFTPLVTAALSVFLPDLSSK